MRSAFAFLAAFLVTAAAAADDAPPQPLKPAGVFVIQPPLSLEHLAGSWGGPLDDAQRKVNDGIDAVRLDVSRAAGRVWRAVASLDCSEKTAEEPLKVRADVTWIQGKEDGAWVLFGAVKGTVTHNGKKKEMTFNPLALRIGPDGRLEALCVGNSGFAVRLPRRLPKPAKPANLDPAALEGSWGGKMGGADLGSGVKLDALRVDVVRAEGDTWTITVRMLTTFPLDGGTQVAVEVKPPPGRFLIRTMRFEKAAWKRSVPETGHTDELPGNVLLIQADVDDTLIGQFEGDDGLVFRLARR